MPQLERFTIGKTPTETEFEKNLEQTLLRFIDQLVEILNGGILLKDNLNCYITTITTNATPGVQTAINHGLKRTPIGCFAIEKNKAGHIYLGASGKSTTTYNVASDVASLTATLIIL